MLFSNDRVADFINKSFEPAWESVRPVPIVRIDFGDGNVLTRTLHGNILTSVCTPDGFVVDALPGIYTESAYLLQLALLCMSAQNLQSVPQDQLREQIVALHRAGAQPGPGVVPGGAGDYRPKYVIENPVKQAIRPAVTVTVDLDAKPALASAEDVARWKALEEDTRLNETARRRQIHELLAGKGLVRPKDVTRPIYKTVLHADLDDPYLGLGEVLFATYPFAKEDAVH